MTPIQAKLLSAIRANTVDGVPPSYELLAAVMGWVSKGNVVRVLKPMKADGLVDWDRGRAHSLRIVIDGPSREVMERWSDDEVRRVCLDLYEIGRARGLSQGRAA